VSDPFPAYFFNGRESTTCFREAVLSPASRYARFSDFWGPAGVREGASRSEGIWATRTMLSTKRAVGSIPTKRR
jgi:hypothetical protein